jgi:hypothetical protein
MAVTSDQITSKNIRVSTSPITRAFVLSSHATNYLEHPDQTGVGICTRGIILSADDTIGVVFASDSTNSTISLVLKGGVVYPFSIKAYRTAAASATVTGLY